MSAYLKEDRYDEDLSQRYSTCCIRLIFGKLAPYFNTCIKTIFPGSGIPIIKVRQLWDCLNSIMGICMFKRWCLHIGTALKFWWIDAKRNNTNVSTKKLCLFLNPLIYQLINSSPPSAEYMRQWIRSALVQVMACRLFNAKPLSELVLGYCQLDP